MPCAGCDKRRRHGSNPGGSKKVSVFGPGVDIKLRYLGDSEELLDFEGPATRKIYVVGGRKNLLVVDSRDLSTGISWAPGLLEMTDDKGAKLFEIHVPLKETAEAKKQKAWADAEARALPPEEKPKSKRKVKSGEGTVSGD